MTTDSVHVSAPGAPAARYSAARLAALLERPPPTAEQTSVIEAPLAPMLVVAGAGSGKTETMASRVVWLIANGIVEPRQVLGLTFTRKAAHELGERIGARLATLAAALRGAGGEPPPGLERGGDELVGQRPLVHTYNGFALDLVREHSLAVGIDPDLTMMSASASWRLAHEIVEGWDDSLDLEASPPTLTAALLSLSSSLADHLVTPERLEAHLREIRDHLSQIPLQVEGRRRTTPKDVAKVIDQLERRLALIPLAAPLRRDPRRRLRTGLLRPGLPRRPHRPRGPRRRGPRPSHAPRGAAGRIPGHLRRPVAHAHRPLRPRACRLRRRRPAAGDLRLARRLGRLPRRLRRRLRDRGAPVLQRTLSTSWRNDEAVLAVANRVAAPPRAAGAGIEIPEPHPRPGAGREPARSSRRPTSGPRPGRSQSGSSPVAPRTDATQGTAPAPTMPRPPPPRCSCAPAARSPPSSPGSRRGDCPPRSSASAGRCTAPRSPTCGPCSNAPTTPAAAMP
uniref:UvrD-helicase domain-containing protein n=1 Tax=Brachybacterium sp. GPGPB12 TaxID=3023517 RepID=UPI0040494946